MDISVDITRGAIRFVVDMENNNDDWWAAARTHPPSELEPLLNDPDTDAVIVPLPRGAELARWAASLPGWKDPDAPPFAPHPLIIEDHS